MKADQNFEVIEKLDESEVFWEMKYLKNAPGNEIEHAIDVKVNPIKFVYEGTFIKFLTGFFTNDAQLQIREQAAEKWADFKEGAQSQLHESMKAGRKDVNIHISSPILLIPLRQNDSNSNLWAVNLGDFTLTSEHLEEDYECYSFGINSVMLKFYEKYEVWEKSAKEELQRKKEHNNETAKREYLIKPTFDAKNFTLLEDFRIESKFAISKSSYTPPGRGEVEVQIKASPVNFNLNNDIYNHLVNIHRCFAYQQPEEIASDMIKTKQSVIDKASLISEVRKRGDNIKTWTSRFAVVSGSYIYIYRESKDLVPEYFLFLKDAKIYDQSNMVGEKHAVEITNKFGEMLLSFNSEPVKESWITEINTIVSELNILKDKSTDIQEKMIKEEHKQQNSEVFNMQLEGPSVNFKWHEIDKTLWFEAELKTIGIGIKKQVVGLKINLGIGGCLMKSHCSHNYFDTIAESRRPENVQENLVEVEILVREKPENPSGDEISILVKMGSIYLNYYPPFMKNLVTRIRNLRYVDEYDFNAILEKRSSEIKTLEDSLLKTIKSSEEDAFKQADTAKINEFESSSYLCDKFPHPYIIFRVSLTEIECDFLHHIYATPFFKIKVGETTFYYDMFVDHDKLGGTLGGIRVDDMTNYPYTYSPEKPESFKNGKVFEVLGLQDINEKNTLSFDC